MFEVCNRYGTCGKYGTQYLPFMHVWPSLDALQTYDPMSFVFSDEFTTSFPEPLILPPPGGGKMRDPGNEVDELSTWHKMTLWNALFIHLSVEHILFIDDYLGQVIVPLSTVNRDQTCRLILPVLPKSSKSEHSRGDITLEVRRPCNATLWQCDSSWKLYGDLVYST